MALAMRMKGFTLIALATLAAVVASGVCHAQREKSLVTTRLEVTGEVRRNLSLSVENLRGIAQRRGHDMGISGSS